MTAVLETESRHTIILTSERMPPFSSQQILSLGIKPEEKQILVVKGVIAPRAADEPIARLMIIVDTAGSTTANPSALPYRRRPRPLYPLEATPSIPARRNEAQPSRREPLLPRMRRAIPGQSPLTTSCSLLRLPVNFACKCSREFGIPLVSALNCTAL